VRISVLVSEKASEAFFSSSILIDFRIFEFVAIDQAAPHRTGKI